MPMSLDTAPCTVAFDLDGTLAATGPDILRALNLALCEAGLEAAKLLLDALGILPLFSAVFGRDSLPYSKPDPRHLTQTVLAARGDPLRAIMVGDSVTDVATARAADIPVICVAFGYSDVPPETLGGDVLIQGFAELPAAVAALDRARKPST
jgi:phosphoglycolate phosphatase